LGSGLAFCLSLPITNDSTDPRIMQTEMGADFLHRIAA